MGDMNAKIIMAAVAALTALAAGAETTSENTQADQGRPLAARKGCVVVDRTARTGPIKPMNAVCNGPHCTDTPMTYSEFEPETLADGSLVFMLEPQSFVYIEKEL